MISPLSASSPSPITMEEEDTQVFVPEWPSQWLIHDEQTLEEIYSSQGRFYPYSQEQTQQMEKILSTLALSHPNIQPPRMRHYPVTCPVRNYCVERLATIGTNFFGNMCQVVKDTACCFCVTKSDPIPKEWVALSQSLWEKLKQNQRDVSRDTACLLCVAPAMIVASPFLPDIVSLEMGIVLNLVLLYAAGIQTFLLVDYGSGELQVTKVCKEGFHHLSVYLKDKWENAGNREPIYRQARAILGYTPQFIQAIVNAGISQDSVDTILGEFNLVLREIVYYGQYTQKYV